MTNIRELLREIARPRMTGSAGAHEVAGIIRTRLNALGYQVHDHPFTFSSLPGRFAVSLCGVLFLSGTLFAAWLLTLRHPGVALSVLTTVLLFSGGVAVLASPMADVLPVGRITGTNMFAVRPAVRPRYIVMAHFDSKSQPLPLALRGPAIILALICWLLFTAFALFALLDPVWIMPTVINALTVLCVISGVLLVMCWAQNNSPGALDNASGVATLIGIAERTDYDDVAFLLTDAEEFGMLGARAIARKLDPVVGVINIDGIDDDGPYYILERFGIPRRRIAPHLAAALLTAADEMSTPARRRDVPFGIYLDHLPLAQAGLPAVSLMRGSVTKSLARVHRPHDSMQRMTGQGVEHAVELVTRALEVLHRQPTGVSL